MTQEEFAESIKISRSNLGNIETKKVTVTERVISDICEKHNINKEWLINGTGDVFIEIDRENLLMAWAGSVLGETDESFKKRFVKMLSELDESDWETLEKIAEKLHKNG
ncbi:helix-turn-helix domain-containing protein [[Clostridium] scindens]|jgi:transcriptional regulator with XRE-family HTH domain|uniref:helix-turn-helix domain-containing protein n=1 Tax=Clostridium scindens (strain JCM 10418 / VPI 12708) TaxID=29347 RepID=UPI001E3026CB